MKQILLFLTFTLFTGFYASSQNCQYGQCSAIKSNGEQCRRCVGYLELYCSSHSVAPSFNAFEKEKKEPTNPTYNLFENRNDCEYSQCIGIKQDGKRCKNCVSSAFDSYCKVHKN